MKAIGLMSGTSLDGVDICLCEFSREGEKWHFDILQTDALPYPHQWQQRLYYDEKLFAGKLLELDHEYGVYLGDLIRDFLNTHNLSPADIDLISSHGHTLFHQPELGYTYQIGNGPELYASLGIPVVCDFRRQDVALGGQGAPLVPIGDRLLFSEYEACLNLGGFSNISYPTKNGRIAFDICPVNFVLNKLASELGYDYDYQGLLASKGSVKPTLLQDLDALEYYTQKPPKSLGAEWASTHILPLIERIDLNTFDKLRTYSEHVATQIARVLNDNHITSCLLSGGGTHNTHLVSLIQNKTNCKLTVPSKEIIDFKEALIFGFMGVLRWQHSTNVLASVTGASRDHSSGIVYQ